MIAELVIARSAATGAFASVIFSGTGAMIFVEDGVVNTTAIAAAAGTREPTLFDRG